MSTVEPISLNRADAAKLLGVSVDTLKAAQAEGKLRAKNTSFHPKSGRANGRTLYALEDLRAWFEGLGDA